MSDFFDITMKDALMHGLTSIHDADAYDASTAFYKRSVLIPCTTATSPKSEYPVCPRKANYLFVSLFLADLVLLPNLADSPLPHVKGYITK